MLVGLVPVIGVVRVSEGEAAFLCVHTLFVEYTPAALPRLISLSKIEQLKSSQFIIPEPRMFDALVFSGNLLAGGGSVGGLYMSRLLSCTVCEQKVEGGMMCTHLSWLDTSPMKLGELSGIPYSLVNKCIRLIGT
jgi:hypothetical protein